jgi:trigger factor
VNPFAKAETDSSSSNTSNEGSASTVLSKDKSLTVKDGDTVNIDYVGSIDGVEFAGGNTQGAGADLTIGSGMYIDNFEEQLIGAHPGDEVDVIVTFPENYGNEELNGKEALFKVVVNGIYE